MTPEEREHRDRQITEFRYQLVAELANPYLSACQPPTSCFDPAEGRRRARGAAAGSPLHGRLYPQMANAVSQAWQGGLGCRTSSAPRRRPLPVQRRLRHRGSAGSAVLAQSRVPSRAGARLGLSDATAAAGHLVQRSAVNLHAGGGGSDGPIVPQRRQDNGPRRPMSQGDGFAARFHQLRKLRCS